MSAVWTTDSWWLLTLSWPLFSWLSSSVFIQILNSFIGRSTYVGYDSITLVQYLNVNRVQYLDRTHQTHNLRCIYCPLSLLDLSAMLFQINTRQLFTWLIMSTFTTFFMPSYSQPATTVQEIPESTTSWLQLDPPDGQKFSARNGSCLIILQKPFS